MFRLETEMGLADFFSDRRLRGMAFYLIFVLSPTYIKFVKKRVSTYRHDAPNICICDIGHYRK